MSDLRVGALLVSGGGSGSSGILTERDIVEKMNFGAPLDSVRVRQLMTPASALQLASPDWTLQHCLHTMTEGHFRHLPVCNNLEVAGMHAGEGSMEVAAMLSIRDLSGALADSAASNTASAAAEFSAAEILRARSRKIQLGGAGAASCVEVHKDSSVAEAVVTMCAARASSVLVPTIGSTIAESRTGFGIFTDRDYVRMLGSAYRLRIEIDPREVQVSRVMTAAALVRSVPAETPALECLAMMARDGMRHLPVMMKGGAGDGSERAGDSDSTSLLAVLSMRDVLSCFLPPGLPPHLSGSTP